MDEKGILADLYTLLIEESFDGIFIQKGTKIVLANSQLHRMLGYSPGELLGKDHWIVYAPEYQGLTRMRAQARMRGEQVPSRYQVKVQRKDGSWRWAEINAKAAMIEGEPGVMVWIKDIHEQKLMEQAVKESTEKFKSAFENASVGALIVDPEGKILECNAFFASLLGYELRELFGRHLSTITHPEDILTDLENNRSLLSGILSSVEMEKRYIKKDGSLVWVRSSSSVIRDENGLPLYVLSYALDVTREKRALEALKEKEAFISSVLEAMPSPIVVYDWDLKPVFVNQRFAKVFGMNLEDLAKMAPHYDSFGEDSVADADLIRTFLSKGKEGFEVKRKNKSGEVLKCVINISRIMVGNRPGFILVISDITELDRLRERAETFQRLEAVGRLASGIAHDFNNLLTGITGTVYMLKLKSNMYPDICAEVQRIESCANKAAELTKHLLTFAKGAPSYDFRPTNLNDVIEDSLKIFERTRKYISVIKLLDKDILISKLDSAKISQVIINLLVNAADAITKEGKIFIESSNVYLDEDYVRPYNLKPGPYVRMAVTDTGIGMPEEIKARIFEPFFTTKAPGEGTGLGLAMAYSIVRDHCGIINCYSEQGKGTTFTVYFPAMEGQSLPEGLEEREEIPQGKEVILVVDDEEVVLEIARDMLTFLGYKVFTANSGREALRLYKELKDGIDLVLLDIVMPEMGGERVFEELRGLNPRQKIVLMSGFGINGFSIPLLEQGKILYLQKPFSAKALAKTVRELLDTDP